MVLEHVRAFIGTPAVDKFLETHPALKG